MDFSSVIPLLLATSILFLLPLYIFLRKPNSKLNLPPGSSGWPFLGESLDYLSHIRRGTLENFVNDRRIKYSSDVFKTSIIRETVAFFPGPEGNKFLFTNENKLVRVWWPKAIERIFPKSNNSRHTEDFASVRRLLSAPLKMDALQRFVGVTDSVMKEHVAKHWCSDRVTVSPVVSEYIIALACKVFVSVEDEEKSKKFMKWIEEISGSVVSMAINIPGTAFHRAMKASKAIRGEILEIIRQRKIDLSQSKASETQDILSLMLLARNEQGQSMDDTDIANYVLGLLKGGFGPLRIALTFIVKFLAEHPDVYSKALEEQTQIAKSKGANELLNWEDLRQMRYSWNVIREVLRLTPIFGAFREAITDFTYNGYTIPKGWVLHIIPQVTHKSAEHFEDPERFDPSRFEGDGVAPYTFLPFGGGPRMCPGNEYSRMMMLVFMHNLVIKFRWEKVIPDEKVVSDPHPRPAAGLPIRLYLNDS